MEIRRYGEEDEGLWNTFIKASKNGVFLFDRGYMDYHRDRFKDHSVFLFKEERVLAVFVACEMGTEIVAHAGLTFGGMVMHYDMEVAEALEAFGLLAAYYKEAGFFSLCYKPVPHPFHRYPSDEDLYALSFKKAALYRRDLGSMVDLRAPIRFAEGKRWGASKAARLGVVISLNPDLSQFWEVLEEVLKKYGSVPVHSLAEISLLRGRFPEVIRLYEARRDGILMAGVLVYDFGTVVHAQYMANSEEGRKTRSLDFVCNQLVTDIYKDRQYFSWGTSNGKEGNYLNEGLVHQKESMGGRGIAYDFYKLEFI